MTLGDRIVVMSGGELQQVGAPQDVYDRPANIFVAGFIGSPPMNLLRGTVVGGRITAGDLTFELGGVPDGEVALGIRPEHLAPAADGLPTFDLQVDVVEPLGDEVIVYGSVAGEVASAEMAVGEERLPPLPGSRAEITARLGPHERPRIGESLALGVRLETVHIFDARTGVAIR
jgi:multiple sugar transport system ATP-binding protein